MKFTATKVVSDALSTEPQCDRSAVGDACKKSDSRAGRSPHANGRRGRKGLTQGGAKHELFFPYSAGEQHVLFFLSMRKTSGVFWFT